jgi:DNA-binding NarL/FixJ family response regulator
MNEMLRVIVADDQQLVQAGFAAILDAEADIDVVGTAENGRVAVQLARDLQPDVVVMDVRMPVMDGIAATAEIVRFVPPTRVLMLTTFDLDEHVYDAMRAGAAGFLLKDAPRGRLAEAVRTVAGGEVLLDPAVTLRLVQRFVQRPAPGRTTPPRFATLSERELDVLRQIATGRSNAEIADHLYISAATTKTHVASILRKLGLRDRLQAVVTAYEEGLVEPQGGA